MPARIAYLVTCLALTPALLKGQTRPHSAGNLLQRFPVGETLLYDARFGLITLGSGMMQVAGVDTIRGVPSLHVVFTLESNTFIYRLNDRMDSWVGLEDFASRRFVQDFHEGGSDRYTAYEIYPDSGFYTESGVDSVRATADGPLDDAAFFYFVRTVDLEVGERYQFNRYFRPDRNPVTIEVLKRDTLDLPAGRFPTILIRPTIKGRGILAEAKEPRMWLSDDERRIMVQLKVKFAFATITLRLREIADPPPSESTQR
ncbi:MAG: DUF3108 domain-containing protein [Gemmatimonadales bacterium]|nr:DUF3108 domain-containing protein [Gemmatimonadales bacterium]NIN13109.1 DUF3108 domain-containing protein [Gemmatimonadales bacterium]NIN51193.1 DUF3108 domain-containing protein [Gemmatimonadales bacterium]NIP08657.1 DUF3108 domain-containing protein [Gemmatimonadales bacterium]NIR02345.1 DUF3108 domain-containing protein [Gemmatimonadales bacterium]